MRSRGFYVLVNKANLLSQNYLGITRDPEAARLFQSKEIAMVSIEFLKSNKMFVSKTIEPLSVNELQPYIDAWTIHEIIEE